ncbi:MAG: hypothetical protein JO040_04755, partial [Gemmatimonadetes bacterium]|nr:hypothetical protein [Gemmatimonadota bacterium]
NNTRRKLNQPYTTYRDDPTSWHKELRATVEAAGEFKYHLSPVVKTDFNTPFDTLIGSTQVYWLPWLDEILQWKEGKNDERLLFGRFADQHPQVEHFGGVVRGGTLVLVHDEANTVVADFMLPYHYHEEPVDEEEPTLTRPFLRPPFVVDKGIKIVPSRTTAFNREWVKRKPEIEQRVDDRIDLQNKYIDDKIEVQGKYVQSRLDDHGKYIQEKTDWQSRSIDQMRESYFNVFQGSLDVIRTGTTDPKMQGITAAGFDDKYLGLLVDEGRLRQQKVDVLTQQAEKAGTREMQTYYQQQLGEAHEALAQTVQQTTDYLSQTGTNVVPGTAGYSAVLQVSSAMNTLAGSTALETAVSGVNNVMSGTKNTSLKLALGTMMNF